MYKRESAVYTVLNISKLALLALVCIGLSSGCARVALMPTPNLYIRAEEDPFAKVAPSLRSNRVEVIYGTDRRPVEEDADTMEYGPKRSMSLAVGVTVAELGEDVSWEELAEASRVRRRRTKIGLAVVETREIGRYPPTTERTTVVNGTLVDDLEAIAAESRIEKLLHEAISERLAATDRKEAYVFVHGYNTTFDFALLTIAQLWHFLGREGVPVLYSWPAGRGGILRGYTADRESGEFTIFHLKQFLKALGSCPDLERINIIAHSRGTDVTLTALRELNIESDAAGKDSGTLPKLGNLILAAPDLDFEVTTQRVGAERLFDVADRFTIYLSPEDKAIWISTWLNDSVRRLGRLLPSDLSPKQKELAPQLPRLQLIDALVKNAGLASGHVYFYKNPAVSSDLILILRYDLDPGEENGRPLIERSYNFWEIHDGYPN